MNMLQEIQREIGKWDREQFKNNKSQDVTALHNGQILDDIPDFYGMVSELGELAAVDVRVMQGRSKLPTNAAILEAREDALADCLIFMCSYATRRGINLNMVLDRVWEKVKKRRQQTWEQDKAKESAELTVGGVEHEQRVARRQDATGNFGAGCEEGHHKFVMMHDAEAILIRRCVYCETVAGS